MIQRRRIYEKALPSKDAQKIYVFCEGDDREKNYFDFFRGMSSNLEIISIPPYNHKSSPNNLIEHAEHLFESESREYTLDYSQKDIVWFVVDTDEWEECGLIECLRSYCKGKNDGKDYPAWNVAQSNPSFEIWLYYHLYENKPNDKEVSSFATFKEYVNSKISGGFDSSIMPIHIEEAIRNSSANFESDGDSPSLYSTEVHNLGNDILKYAGKDIQLKKRTLI